MKKSLAALSFGTFALGIAEFAMMGILPYVAGELKITLAQAGHFISAYALGVCCGAPFLIAARKMALKRILLILAFLIFMGNISASLAWNYWVLLLGRFVSGLPHGAYFGVATIVASKVADKGKCSQAVSIMVAGMTVANLFGVPLGTSVSQIFSWRITFVFVGLWGLLVFWFVLRWVPDVEKLKQTTFREQFLFLKKPAPWLLLGATVFGNGGVFCWYSYINPMLTNVSGFADSSITAIMMLAGTGMVAGNLISGRMSDKYSPGSVGSLVLFMICLVLLGLFFFSSVKIAALILLTLCTAGLFAVSAPEQWLIVKVAPGGEMLAGSCIQIAFNFGNAVGAYIGGFALNLGYEYPALSGLPFTVMGFLMFFTFYRKYQKKYL